MSHPQAALDRVTLYDGDLPSDVMEGIVRGGFVAWDIETSGLDWNSERIGTCQLYVPGQPPCLVQLRGKLPERLKLLLNDPGVTKLFHHAMFDLRFMAHHWEATPQNIICTKIASKILDPSSKDHSLKALVKRNLNVSLDKRLQTSDWLAEQLTPEQVTYAVGDVLYLPRLFECLEQALRACGRWDLAVMSFQYVPARVQLDLIGAEDVFRH